MAKKPSTKNIAEYVASDFSALNAHVEGVVNNEQQLARLKRFRADRALIKNVGIILLVVGFLAVLLAYAYNRANAPVIEIIEKPVYIDKPEYIIVKVPDPELSEQIEVPIYIDRFIRVPIQIGAVEDEFSFFHKELVNKDGILSVTRGASYESVNSPYPEEQWCYATGQRVISENYRNEVNLGDKSGTGAPIYTTISQKDAEGFGASVAALEDARKYCMWHPDKPPISDINEEPPLVSTLPPEEPPIFTGGSGTGFYINKNGYLLTNEHVVKDCSSIYVDDGNIKIKATIVKKDLNLDIAALRIIRKTEYYAKFGEIRTGEDVMALGFPLDDVLGTEIKATKGNVSSLSGYKGEKNSLQFTAPIQPGNSGGPLLNEGGLVVGINTAFLEGEGVQNINFAIKGTSASSFLGKNSIEFEYATYDQAINSADIVELGKKFTVRVLCYE